MNIDKSRFIETFKIEAEEYLTILNQGLVRLEKDSGDIELRNELFRAAHTLKGAARMMGFLKIRDVSHKLEDLFSLIKDDKLQFKGIIADIVFKALDLIKEALNKVVRGKEEGIAIEEICSRIDKVCGNVTAPSRDEEIKMSKDWVQGKEGSRVQSSKIQREDRPSFAKASEGGGETKDEGGETREERRETTIDQRLPTKNRGLKTEDSERGTGDRGQGTEVRPDEYIRVPVSRINQLLNLIGEMVINKVKSSYKMTFFKRLSKRALIAEKMLYDFENVIKENLDIPDEYFQSKGAVLRSSHEKPSRILDSLHHLETMFTNFRKELTVLSDEVQNEIFHLNPIIEELQQKIKEIRMLPCSTIFEGFPRMVRDIAKEQNKGVAFTVKGGETELDKKVLEAIKGPLIHVLRNSIDHGIEMPSGRKKNGKKEEGQISLEAFQEGGKVVIQVTDDGQGIDFEFIKETALKKKLVTEKELAKMSDEESFNLIFTDGFSTSPIITDVSGRGVGLSVVRVALETLKGSVNITSEKGKGTTVRMELPLTIAILQVLLVSVDGISWAFPMQNLEESLKIKRKDAATIENRMIIQVRGQSVPIVPLSDVLGLSSKGSTGEKKEEILNEEMTVVIVNSLNKRIGFIVDAVLGEHEVFIKNLGTHLGKVKGVSGVTILPSGDVIVILDIPDLVTLAQLSHPAVKVRKAVSEFMKKRVLVVEDSLTTRELEKTILENHGYDVDTAIDGLDALDKLSAEPFDLVVSDVQMPRMDGFELCKNMRLREKLKTLPLIFVTALSRDEEKRKGIEVGAQAYIMKSQFDQSNLLEIIDRLI